MFDPKFDPGKEVDTELETLTQRIREIGQKNYSEVQKIAPKAEKITEKVNSYDECMRERYYSSLLGKNKSGDDSGISGPELNRTSNINIHHLGSSSTNVVIEKIDFNNNGSSNVTNNTNDNSVNTVHNNHTNNNVINNLSTPPPVPSRNKPPVPSRNKPPVPSKNPPLEPSSHIKKKNSIDNSNIFSNFNEKNNNTKTNNNPNNNTNNNTNNNNNSPKNKINALKKSPQELTKSNTEPQLQISPEQSKSFDFKPPNKSENSKNSRPLPKKNSLNLNKSLTVRPHKTLPNSVNNNNIKNFNGGTLSSSNLLPSKLSPVKRNPSKLNRVSYSNPPSVREDDINKLLSVLKDLDT